MVSESPVTVLGSFGVATADQFVEPVALLDVDGGDVRGWFSFPTNDEAPICRGFVVKRLKGFEPSTFCMAINPAPETSSGEPIRFAALFCSGANGAAAKCAAM
jgi:hypothetical protein